MRMRYGSRGSRPHASRGLTLVEVLVALVILSVGLLGVARLQLLSLRGNTSAFMRSQATLLAYDVIDRIRTNVQVNADITNPANILGVASNYNTTGFTSTPPAANDCTAVTCNAADLAAYDVQQWILRVTDGDVLPGGEGRIVCAGNPVICTVSLRWQAPATETQAGGVNSPYGNLEVAFSL